MEISTLEAGEREALLELLDLWQLPDGWRGRDFFRRFMDEDPSFRNRNIWVARCEAAPIACVQIFPRRLRLLGHAVPTGGIGSVFTHPDHRHKGIASQLLGRAAAAMREAGMELSMLFSNLAALYGAWGWRPQSLQRSLLRVGDAKPMASAPREARASQLGAFDRTRDYEQVKAIHWSYSAPRSGTVIRDPELWEASLALAGNPSEEFLVARRDAAVVAYLRCTLLSETLVVTEIGRVEDASDLLAELISGLLWPRKPDPLTPPGTTSRELRSSLVLPAFDDIPLAVALEQRGVSMEPIEDRLTMLRCLNLPALAQRLDIRLLPGEDADAFLGRVLPRDSLVFWPADRF